MPLPSFSAGHVRLQCVLRFSRSLSRHSASNFGSRTSNRHLEGSSRWLTTTRISREENNPVNDTPAKDGTSSASLPGTTRIVRQFRRIGKVAEHAQILENGGHAMSLSFKEFVDLLLSVKTRRNYFSLSFLGRLVTIYGQEPARKVLESLHHAATSADNGSSEAPVPDLVDFYQKLGVIPDAPFYKDFGPEFTREERKTRQHLFTVHAAAKEQKPEQEPEQKPEKASVQKPEKKPDHNPKPDIPDSEGGVTVSKHSSLRIRKLEQKKKLLLVRKQKGLVPRKILSEDPSKKPDAASGRRRRATPQRLKAKSSETPDVKVTLPPPDAYVTDTGWIAQIPVEMQSPPDVPTLSFDLSRVLFNPGVYQLQDPRSRVYNFDPYLKDIMPVSEFNWNALNAYITSSEDTLLQDVATQQKKKYIGSSSSMSGAMSQFHFLLSAWRPLDFSSLSQKVVGLTSFTQITRAPASIFLRYRDGVYAVDADKEHDAPNILMMQGKSMEKLLTLEKAQFEKYRKPKEGEDAPFIESKPEAYHYTTCENFLLRSQLDAYDPRLPGTGMFDLKTRSVAGIRMHLRDHKSGMGYQIRDRFGLWESYEREYYDMIRAAFLKYSLQVRMGRMDGIFVAYHNIAQIFGFQYISISELDIALHGQADPCVGDREFRATIKLMNEVFDRATAEFPGQSLRFMFETREPTTTDPSISMKIFAEVVTEEQIEKIQGVGKRKVLDYEANMALGINPKEVIQEKVRSGRTIEETFMPKTPSSSLTPSTLESTAPDQGFLDQILGIDISSILSRDAVSNSESQVKKEEDSDPTQVACWTLRIFNEVNGTVVVRPESIEPSDRWNVHYTITRETEKVQSMYNSIKNKRRTMFTFDEDEDPNYFTRMIIRMNNSGRTWRAEQDALDAERDKVVLYK